MKLKEHTQQKVVIKSKDYVFNFGKHKGHSLDTVLEEDADYILWLNKQDWCIVAEYILQRAEDMSTSSNSGYRFSPDAFDEWMEEPF